MAEWFNAPVLKTGVRKDSWVRIPPPPLEESRVLRSSRTVEAPLRSNPRDFRKKALRGYDSRGRSVYEDLLG